MRKLICSMLLLTSVAYGQDLKDEIRLKLNDIRRELNHVNDRQVLLRTNARLQSTLDHLLGQNPNPNPNPLPNNGEISCLARDNDGQAPWVLGIKDPVTLHRSKLPASNVGSLENCNRAKRTAVRVNGSIFVCIARDNDGQNPYVIAHYRDNKLVKKINNLGSLDDCATALNNVSRSYEAIAFCATRDNDGQAPYVEMSVVAQTGQTRRAGSYQNLQQCISAKKLIKL